MAAGPPPGGDATALIKRLGGMTAHPPQERMWEEITRLVEAVAALPPLEGRPARLEAAFLLASRTHAAGADVQAFYGTLLPLLGPDAAPACIMSLLRRMEEDPKFKPDLAEVAGPILAHVVNRLLSDRHRLYEPLRDAALAALPSLRQTPEDEARAFLDEAARTGLQVAFPVAEAFLDGPYGARIQSAMEETSARIARSERPDKDFAETVLRHTVLRRGDFARELAPVLETKHAPTLAASLLSVLRGRPGADSKLAVASAKAALHPDRKVKVRAVAALNATAPKDQGKVLASLARKDPLLRRIAPAVLPFFPGREYAAFAKLAGGKDFAAETLAVLLRLDPEAVRGHVAALPKSLAAGAAALAALIPGRARPAEFDADKAAKAFKPAKDKKAEEPKKKEKDSFFSSMFGGGGGGGGEGISIQFGSTAVSDSEYSGKKISPIYEDRTLNNIDFSNAFLENAVFQGCTFVSVKLKNTLVRGARFVDCVFENCTFDGARFFETTFSGVQASRSSMREMILADCRLSLLAASECDLTGLRLYASKLRTVRFAACDLSGLAMTESESAGTELVLCRVERPRFDRARMTNHTMAACSMTGPGFLGLFSDHPNLMRLEDSCRYARAEGMAVGGMPETPKLDPDAAKAAQAVVRDWFRSRDLRASMVAFQENNLRRESWCLDRLGPEKSVFYRLAPLLLHSEMFEKNTPGVEPLPLATRMAGYEPDYTTLESARALFPSATLPPAVPDPIHVEALYTIGSVGTVAQTPSSDLDYWVCYDPEDMPDILVDGLMDKLEHIERWADATFGLEVHFFTMDLTKIQQNNFGFSDQESSGSAQALLLKEEFYRTAVCVAGKVPLWWMTPVGTSDEDYAATRKFAQRTDMAERFTDLGNLVEIPPSEFFGASLWQIVKALKSPFKSIMKFGLLEKYIATGNAGASMLLCDRLKANLLLGRTGINEADPYMLLFREVSGHYAKSREKDSLTLVRLSFFLKTKIKQVCTPGAIALRSEDKQIATQFAKDEACAGGGETGEDWSFDRLEHVGGLVNKFIVRTYMRVRDKQSESAEIAITPEDLTKLGRKIFSNFSKRKHKIEHMPFLSIGGNSFRVLHVQAKNRKMNRPVDWAVQGAQEIAAKDRLQLVNLRAGMDLAEILVWLASNKLYLPGIEVRGDYSISPVTARDVQALLDRLVDFFPPGPTFNTDIGEMLQPERIMRAFFILNLIQPREQATVSEATIVYSTNWGELFCRTVAVQNASLLNNPAEFLLQTVEQEFTEPPVMDFFVPDRSSCPRPTI